MCRDTTPLFVAPVSPSKLIHNAWEKPRNIVVLLTALGLLVSARFKNARADDFVKKLKDVDL